MTSFGFGQQLAVLMEEQAMSFRGLGHRTGLTHGYLNLLVHRKREPSREAIERIARALRVLPEHFRAYRIMKVVDGLAARPDLADALYEQFTRPV